MNRRTFLTSSLAVSAAAWQGVFPQVGLAAEKNEVLLNAQCPIPFDKTLRDRLWMWGHDAGSLARAWGLDEYGGGNILPVDAIESMGIPNVCMVPFTGTPRPEEYAEYAQPFHRPSVKRFTWSFVHGKAKIADQIRQSLYAIAPEYPHFVGLDMDDFFHGNGDPQRNFDVWLAGNLSAQEPAARFPVTWTATLEKPVAIDRIELMQSDWEAGNFRTKEVTVLLRTEDGVWKEVAQQQLSKEARSLAEMRFPRTPTSAIQLKITSTHDTGSVCSVGLKRLFAYDGNHLLDWSSANVTASSLWGHGEFPAESLVRPWNEEYRQGFSPAAYTPSQVTGIQEELQTTAPQCRGKKLDLSIVLYSNQLHPAIRQHLQRVDVVYFWTWVAKDLIHLEKNFATYRAILPKHRTRLGIYMWDFGAKKPISRDLMELQCKLALQWLRSGEVEGLIFHCTPLCDMNLEAVDFARRWIDTYGESLVMPC